MLLIKYCSTYCILSRCCNFYRLCSPPSKARWRGGSSPTSKHKAPIASRMSSGMNVGLVKTSWVGTFTLSSSREVPGPIRRRRSQSNIAYLARVMSGAQGTSRRNRGVGGLRWREFAFLGFYTCSQVCGTGTPTPVPHKSQCCCIIVLTHL